MDLWTIFLCAMGAILAGGFVLSGFASRGASSGLAFLTAGVMFGLVAKVLTVVL